jgi:hypothetical protein
VQHEGRRQPADPTADNDGSHNSLSLTPERRTGIMSAGGAGSQSGLVGVVDAIRATECSPNQHYDTAKLSRCLP